MSAVKPLSQAWPIAEIFGPTVQGEGVDQGVAAHFVRFGGCDYKCEWCDTPHAVLPEEVKTLGRKTSGEIVLALEKLPVKVPWVILTGGNPCLHDLEHLVNALHAAGFLVAVETQGSRWREWLRKVDRLCVSPKPPSSGMDIESHRTDIQKFLIEGMTAKLDEEKSYEWMFLKVVIFNEDDLDYAEKIRKQLSNSLLYLSAGNDAGRTVGNPTRKDERSQDEVKLDLLDKAEWLVGEVFKRPDLLAPDVIVQSQFHVLIWGNQLER